MKATSAERMRKMKAKRAAQPNFDKEKYQIKYNCRFPNFGRRRKNKPKGMKKDYGTREYEQMRWTAEKSEKGRWDKSGS